MKLLIFDFDGTLADTGKVIQLTIAQTLKELNQTAPSENELRRYIGLPLAKIFEMALNTHDQNLINDAVRIHRARFPENCKTGVNLYPGVRETLHDFKKTGLILAIASSREKNSLLSLVDYLDIRSFFSIITGEQDVKRHKPAPDIANYVMEKAGIAAEDSMFIGDTVFDIQTGRAAGLKTCGASYGNHTKQQLEEAGADCIINTFSELKDIVLT